MRTVMKWSNGTMPNWLNSRVLFLLAAVFSIVSCENPSGVEGPDPLLVPPFVISNAVPDPAQFSSTAAASTATLGTSVVSVVYVSLETGAIPDGRLANIQNTRTGVSVAAIIVNGGFDPIAVNAIDEDSLAVEVLTTAGARKYGVRIAKKKPPKVVRTDPPTQKRDVPLNYNIVVVFSEPIDPASLSTATVNLRTSTGTVAGQVSFSDVERLKVIFTSDSAFEPNTAYKLMVTDELRDADGDKLEESLEVNFTTAALSPVPKSISLAILPVSATIEQGKNVAVAVTITRVGGYAGVVNISVSGMPGELSTSVTNMATVDGITTAVLTFFAVGAQPGVYPLLVRGSGAGVTQATAPLSLTITPAPVIPPPLPVLLLFSDIGNVGNFACGLEAQSGLAYCWGDNHSGALGIGDANATGFPQAVSGALRYSSISVGFYTTCGIQAVSGLAFCWGYNRNGSLGDGTFISRSVPTLVQSDGIAFSSISSGGDVTCGIVALTSFPLCWGKGGLVGDGTLSTRSLPTPIGNGSLRFSSISASSFHVCGVEVQTGFGYCWGANEYGQLGDNTTSERLVPTPVVGGRSFSSISAGYQNTCAIEAGSGLGYCWGANDVGQIGDGTTIARLLPTLVDGGRRFARITSGVSPCAIETPTSLGYCWGRNDLGQVGDGTTMNRLFPTLVGGGSLRFTSISSSGFDVWGVEAQTGAAYWWGWGSLVPVRLWDGTAPQ